MRVVIATGFSLNVYYNTINARLGELQIELMLGNVCRYDVIDDIL